MAKRASKRRGQQPGVAVFADVYHGAPWGTECCGRLVWHPVRGDYIFEHEHTASQRHWLTSSPGGYDAVVLGFLVSNQVELICDIETTAEGATARWASVTDVVLRGEFHADAGRLRFFLPYGAWTVGQRDYPSPPPTLPRLNLTDNWLSEVVRLLRRNGRPIPGELLRATEAIGL